ncbi:unnamed protein product, partial [Scytosiphon promiscuus]
VSGQFSFDVSANVETDGSIRVVAGPDDEAEPCKADSYTDLTGEVEFNVQTGNFGIFTTVTAPQASVLEAGVQPIWVCIIEGGPYA